MAFRSELDAMRERAAGAEAEARRLAGELDAQQARIDRVADVESQLEAARAQLRVSKTTPYAFLRGSVLPLVLGVSVGAGAVFLDGQRRSAHERESAMAAEVHRASELRALEIRVESASAESAAASAERDEVRSELRRGHDELRDLTFALSGSDAVGWPASGDLTLAPSGVRVGRPLPFGRVTSVDGDAPVVSGAECELVAIDGPDACAAQIRCGGAPLHSVGCPAATMTRLRGHGGNHVSVENEVLGWTVVVDASPHRPPPPPGPGAPLPPAGVPIVPLRPVR